MDKRPHLENAAVPPCKDCKDRTIHCHSTCDKYLSYRKEIDKLKEKHKVESVVEQGIYEAIERSIKARMK